ncbi:hypothetical protein [Daejeonella oryzae]|uniref:hypothetical protein n=1 Tax=Daejeonella oryzae TaxID=1122943 RepID=UPI00041BCFBA|nr:hypothetical protein [Daejeonella oryzae]
MKKLFTLLTIATFLISSGFNENEEKGLSRVNKVQGIEVYVLSEPLRDYEVISDVGTGISTTSAVTGGLVNESIADKISSFVRKAMKENSRIDAVVYSSGKRIVGIRFKDTATPTTKGIGRVKKIGGLDAYVLAEPLQDYEVLTNKSGGIKWKSAITGGLINNSIEDDLEKMAKKVSGTGTSVDGMIYSSGKTASGFRYR